MSSCNGNPFDGMKIKDWSILEKIEGRSVCPKCNKSRKYFCYTCYVPVPELEVHTPRVKLPLKIDIIKHASETDGKSTAAHAAIIAPDDVSIYTYPCIPDYNSDENVVLIFPGKNALSIKEYIAKATSESSCEDDCSEPPAKKSNSPKVTNKVPISRAVFIDSTWNQSRGIYKDQRLREIPCVVIQSRISQFWRHQHGSPRWFLATVEAIHQFLVEVHILCNLGVKEISEMETTHGENSNNKSRSADSSFEDKPLEKQTSSTSSSSNPEEKHASSSRPDKQPSKFVKNLALCRGVRLDPGGSEPGIDLCGPDQWKGKYNGDYDNLLFFFQFMYHKIHSLYDHDKLKSYQRVII